MARFRSMSASYFEESLPVAAQSALRSAKRKPLRAKGTRSLLPTTSLSLAITPLGPNLYDSKFWRTGRTFRSIEPGTATFAASDLRTQNIFTADFKG